MSDTHRQFTLPLHNLPASAAEAGCIGFHRGTPDGLMDPHSAEDGDIVGVIVPLTLNTHMHLEAAELAVAPIQSLVTKSSSTDGKPFASVAYDMLTSDQKHRIAPLCMDLMTRPLPYLSKIRELIVSDIPLYGEQIYRFDFLITVGAGVLAIQELTEIILDEQGRDDREQSHIDGVIMGLLPSGPQSHHEIIEMQGELASLIDLANSIFPIPQSPEREGEITLTLPPLDQLLS